MAFSALQEKAQGVAVIKLAGELDANSAADFKAEVEKAIADHPQRLVLLMQDLDYMASAGLRVLIYTRQKLGTEVDIYMVGVQDMVKDTLEKTGFSQSVYLVDSYEM